MKSEVDMHRNRHTQVLPQHLGGSGIGFGSAVVDHDHGIVMMAEFCHSGSLVGRHFYGTAQGVAQGFGDPGCIGHGTDHKDTMLQR
jgi:hypothetical protein